MTPRPWPRQLRQCPQRPLKLQQERRESIKQTILSKKKMKRGISRICHHEGDHQAITWPVMHSSLRLHPRQTRRIIRVHLNNRLQLPPHHCHHLRSTIRAITVVTLVRQQCQQCHRHHQEDNKDLLPLLLQSAQDAIKESARDSSSKPWTNFGMKTVSSVPAVIVGSEK